MLVAPRRFVNSPSTPLLQLTTSQRRFDPQNGLQSFNVSWISKASAAQRAGRAGRTGPGHCYRLYSSALFESHFTAHAAPEVERTPVEGVVLQMKSMGIEAVVNFPFPTPPERDALRRAEVMLAHLGALAGAGGSGGAVVVGGRITPLGKTMALFPVGPRIGKMLVVGRQQGCLVYTVAIAAALSVGDPFLREEALEGDDEDEAGEESAIVPEFREIRSEELRAKEVRKARRREFFKAVQVSYLTSCMRPILELDGVADGIGAFRFWKRRERRV